MFYIADVWPAKIPDYPVPSDNDFVLSRKADLHLMDKTEYEESVSKMITDYIDLVENLIGSLKKQGVPEDEISKILDNKITKSTIHTPNKKSYRELLLKGKFDIDRIMRIERKDDTYSVGLAMEDFSSGTVRQLIAFGKYDALDKLIHTLLFTVQNFDEKEGGGAMQEIKHNLNKHLQDAASVLGNKANDSYSYSEVMNHLDKFIDEVNRMDSHPEKTIREQARLLKP